MKRLRADGSGGAAHNLAMVILTISAGAIVMFALWLIGTLLSHVNIEMRIFGGVIIWLVANIWALNKVCG